MLCRNGEGHQNGVFNPIILYIKKNSETLSNLVWEQNTYKDLWKKIAINIRKLWNDLNYM